MEDDFTSEGRKLTLRIQSKERRAITLKNIPSTTKIEDFMLLLEKETCIPSNLMCLLIGYPPRKIRIQPNMTIEQLGITNHETIKVEQLTTHFQQWPEVEEGNRLSDYKTDQRISAVNTPSPIQVKSDDGFKRPKLTEDCTQISNIKSNVSSPKIPSSSSKVVPLNTSEGSHVPNLPNNMPMNVSKSQPRQSPRDLLTHTQQPGNNFDGVMLRKTIPSDNSCLFSAITFCVTGAENVSSEDLRSIIVTKVLSDPAKYNEGFLGQSNLDYCNWISRMDSWGGGIELSILSEHFQMEITVMDSLNIRMNTFGEDKHYDQRIFLIYDGIHYDALYCEFYDGRPKQMIFSTNNMEVYNQVLELGIQANQSHQFTDVKNFTLKCTSCGAKFHGPKEAEAHAKETRHDNFEETN